MTLLLKKLDFSIQVLLILVIIITWLSGFGWFYVYFTLGGWQIFSLLTHHLAAADFRSSVRRKAYAWSALTALILAIIGLNSSVLISVLFLLVIGTPVLALWYLSISFLEIRALNLKNIVHMKR